MSEAYVRFCYSMPPFIIWTDISPFHNVYLQLIYYKVTFDLFTNNYSFVFTKIFTFYPGVWPIINFSNDFLLREGKVQVRRNKNYKKAFDKKKIIELNIGKIIEGTAAVSYENFHCNFSCHCLWRIIAMGEFRKNEEKNLKCHYDVIAMGDEISNKWDGNWIMTHVFFYQEIILQHKDTRMKNTFYNAIKFFMKILVTIFDC